MKLNAGLTFAFTCLAAWLQCSDALEVGQNVCVEGYVMDFFCIERGTLLDRSDVVTLEGPDKHSIHCLVDVPSCLQSPFEILLDPENEGELYGRGFRITQETKTIVADRAFAARSEDGFQVGFRAVINATVISLATSEVPIIIEAHEAFHSNFLDVPCDAFGMQNVIDEISEKGENQVLNTVVSTGNFQQKALAHGSLMLIGWGFLLPTGTLFARFFKHRPDGLWFKIHQACQVLGLLFAFIGWIIALRNFTVFQDKGLNNYRHGVMGMVTMILGLLQPLNAAIRPHPPAEGEEKDSTRLAWELVHKGSGYCAVLLAVATIGLGTTLVPPDVGKKFQMAYGIGCGSIFVVLVIFMMADKSNYTEVPQKERDQKKMDEEEVDEGEK